MQVFLVEDSVTVRERVAAMLEATPSARLAGHAADAESAIRDILAGSPAPQIDFYVLSNVSSYPYRQLAGTLGARGFFDKSTEFERVRELLAARAGAGAP